MILGVFMTFVMTGAYFRYKYGPLQPKMKAWVEERFGDGAWGKVHGIIIAITAIVWGAYFLISDPAERGGQQKLIDKFQNKAAEQSDTE